MKDMYIKVRMDRALKTSVTRAAKACDESEGAWVRRAIRDALREKLQREQGAKAVTT